MRNGNGSKSSEESMDLRGKIPPMTTEEISKVIEQQGKRQVVIKPPNIKRAIIEIKGISPYVQNAFSQKARLQMEETQRAGTQAKSKKNRSPRDFEAQYEAAHHRSADGWIGIPAPAFRNACIDACRLVGFVMTKAKLSIFIVADGYDAVDRTPLVKISGEPFIHKGWGRNADGGADLRWRPMWEEWSAKVMVRWDEDQFSASDVVNLMARAGLQVGIGEGRPSSPNSNGLDWGLWEVVGG
jgi:hypothetical protein